MRVLDLALMFLDIKAIALDATTNTWFQYSDNDHANDDASPPLLINLNNESLLF